MTTVRRTHRWVTVLAFTALASATGVATNRPFILLSAIVGVTFMVYSHVTESPEVTLCLYRTVSETSPEHGDAVTVTVRIENTGNHTLPDIRLIDGVPPMLSVVDGTARHATALRPSSSTCFSYVVTAKHGLHSFQPATVIARDLSGAIEVETTITEADSASKHARIECPVEISTVSLRQQTHQFTGRVRSDELGPGVEFDRIREYRHGDPPGRIDWNRFARTNRLATVAFRAERSRTVILCLDARQTAYCASSGSEPYAVSYEVALANGLFTSLISNGNRVGIAAIGRTFGWLAPRTGSAHHTTAKQMLATHPTLSVEPPDTHETVDDEHVKQQLRALEARLNATAQIVVLSPLSDDYGTRIARRYDVHGYAPTVISPDVTTDETLGRRLGRVERRNRIHSLRTAGIPVVNWQPQGPVEAALQRMRYREQYV